MCQGLHLAPSRIVTLTKHPSINALQSGRYSAMEEVVTILFCRFHNKAHLRHRGDTDFPHEILGEQALEGELFSRQQQGSRGEHERKASWKERTARAKAPALHMR